MKNESRRVIKANWDIFRAKFSENPQDNFEWFCYLLFCKKYKLDEGVFGYKNQAAIETDPINAGSDVIGWQAKFYNDPLSNKKSELLKIIKDVKKKYPEITKLYIYTNQWWSQSHKKEAPDESKPKALVEIDGLAAKYKITLVWNGPKFFESPFVCIDNSPIAQHFFSIDKSIIDLIVAQKKHTERVLLEVQTNIDTSKCCIEINRSNELDQLKNNTNKVLILSGIGGCGKTSIIKKLYESMNSLACIFVLKASEFGNLNNVSKLFSGISLESFIDFHEKIDNKILIIDSAERLLDIENTDPFKEFFAAIFSAGWKVIFTARNNYLNDLNARFFEILGILPLNISIDILSLTELNDLSKKHSFTLGDDKNLLELLRNPFYLNKYLQSYDDNEKLNYISFKNKIWNLTVKRSEPTREQYFLQIAYQRANDRQFYINNSSSLNSNILDKLVKDGVLGYEKNGYFITHDIYEEWALEIIIQSEFEKNEDEAAFLKQLGQSLPIRRSFRKWLSEKLLLKEDAISRCIENIIDNKLIAKFWKDEVLVSVLLSDNSNVFFDSFKDQLLSNEQDLFKRIAFILLIACNEVDTRILDQLGINDINKRAYEYLLTRPIGSGWSCFIRFVYENLDNMSDENIKCVYSVVLEWNSKVKTGETTRLSSLIVLREYQKAVTNDYNNYKVISDTNIIKTILYGASEIKDELEVICNDILKNKWKNNGDPYAYLSEAILTKQEGIFAIQALPKYVLKLADLFWTYTPKVNKDYLSIGSRIDIDQHFGLETNNYEYHPASSFQTPIYQLLRKTPQVTIKFILDFINKSVQAYAISGVDSSIKEVKVLLGDGVSSKQYISSCLWQLYRGAGSPVSPYLLQSIHMALEKFFLELGGIIESEQLEKWLLHLLKHTKSSSISSVVTSIVLAYPEKCFNVAKVLFQTKEFILLDTDRRFSENQALALYSIGNGLGDLYSKSYDEERIETCGNSHRKLALENLFLQYQNLYKDSDASLDKLRTKGLGSSALSVDQTIT